MTVTPWSDAAKALVGVAFGNPAMRSEQEKADLERQKVEIQNKQYMLEEALNPAKIGQAEAAARYNNAQAQSEGVEMMMKQLKLDAQKRRIDGVNNPPTMAPMPAYNPMNIGPQGQGRNPAMTLPYDQIEPLDMVPQLDAGAVSDEAFDAQQVTPLPVGAPYNPATMPSGPNTADPFDELIAGLTGGPAMPPQPVPLAPMEAQGSAQPQDMTQMLTPEIVDMMAAGWLPGQNIGDYLLAQEGFAANQGVTDPNKRILNAAAGRGTFASPDQVTAQAMGSTLPTTELSQLGRDNMGTTDIKNFRESEKDPDFATFLATQNAGQEIEFNPDGTIKRIGKGGGKGKPMTEQQSKVALNASVMAPGVAALTNAYNGGKASSASNLAVRAMLGDDPFITDMAQRANLINDDDQMLNAAVNGVMNFLYLQTGAARTESEDKRGYVELTPLASDSPETRNFKKAQLEQKARSIIRQAPTPEMQQELLRAVEGIWTSQIPGSTNQIGEAPVQIQSDEEYEALPSGATFLAPDGTTRTKP